MKSSLRAVPVYLVAALVFQACANPTDHKKPSTVGGKDAVPLKQITEVASEAVAKSESMLKLKAPGLRLKSAAFTFKTVSNLDRGGELGILVVNASVSVADQTTESVTYTYERPKVNLLAMSFNPNVERLVTAINSKLDTAISPNVHDIPLSEIKIQVDFGVERKIGASAKIPAWGITIGPKVSASQNASQSITLIFGK